MGVSTLSICTLWPESTARQTLASVSLDSLGDARGMSRVSHDTNAFGSSKVQNKVWFCLLAILGELLKAVFSAVLQFKMA